MTDEGVNNFPSLGINTEELRKEVYRLLDLARENKDDMGAVNWGDLGIADIQYRLSMLWPDIGPGCTVIIEEASPDSGLASWLHSRLNDAKFPNVFFECEW